MGGNASVNERAHDLTARLLTLAFLPGEAVKWLRTKKGCTKV